MPLAEHIPRVLKTSLIAIMFALGPSARPGHLVYRLKRPSDAGADLALT